MLRFNVQEGWVAHNDQVCILKTSMVADIFFTAWVWSWAGCRGCPAGFDWFSATWTLWHWKYNGVVLNWQQYLHDYKCSIQWHMVTHRGSFQFRQYYRLGRRLSHPYTQQDARPPPCSTIAESFWVSSLFAWSSLRRSATCTRSKWWRLEAHV